MKIKLTCVLLLSVFSVATFAGQDRGGGDLCEDRIKTVRDDISKWIKDGGANNLNLPSDVSLGQYQDEMQNQISKAKIRCVGKGDVGHPVTVDGISKVCRFDISKKESLITCDYTKFQAISDNDKYILVHHEYAGLANIERPDGTDSDYSLSNQISGYLVNKVVKQLAVKPFAVPGINENFYISVLPRKTVLEFPVNITIYPKFDIYHLDTIKLGKDRSVRCSFVIPESSEDIRIIKGNVRVELLASPFYYDGRTVLSNSARFLNGKPTKVFSVFECTNVWDNGRDYGQVTIQELREYFEMLGGSVKYPEVVTIE